MHLSFYFGWKCKHYVEKILEAGIQEQDADKDYYIVRKKIEYSIPGNRS